ncbi:hypothetical protein BDZ94DRAFT_1232485 [Collybia nuda]|uniref:Uncharacterized protein n=1 Tax=Collybia nuda TaxID=64659 RepID=A0A9P6CNN7_9AGAR|nr:hypothetical protein BDZ94DRAFT_1232485 [Collybia nuda]
MCMPVDLWFYDDGKLVIWHQAIHGELKYLEWNMGPNVKRSHDLVSAIANGWSLLEDLELGGMSQKAFPSWKHFFTVLGTDCQTSTLTALRIFEQFRPPTSHSDVDQIQESITIDTLRPLLAFTNLEVVKLALQLPYDLDIQATNDIAHCHRLECLEIFINTIQPAEPRHVGPADKRNSVFPHLGVGSSLISNPAPIVTQLRQLFPRGIKKLTSTSVQSPCFWSEVANQLKPRAEDLVDMGSTPLGVALQGC